MSRKKLFTCKFFKLGKPAARVGDGHICPVATPGTGVPHLGGPVTGPGCATVLIENLPAATAGDLCTCAGAMDKITDGSTGVFIGGKPAARLGDPCMHGGVVTSGSGLVLIGESMGRNFLWLPCVWEEDGEHIEPSRDEKIGIVKMVIAQCIDLLEKRLELLNRDDPGTLANFDKWFGYIDEERKSVIVSRIERQIVFFKDLGMDKFSRVVKENDYLDVSAQVYPLEKYHTIYLGHLFWNNILHETQNREVVLIHEVSHFKHIGGTLDYAYEKQECEDLLEDDLRKVLFNANSYAFFIADYK